MKKIAITLAAVAALGVAACNNTSNDANNTATDVNATDENTLAAGYPHNPVVCQPLRLPRPTTTPAPRTAQGASHHPPWT